jgi:hypothetical protein
VKKAIVLAWASFVAAGVAEIVFFTVFDPAQLYFLGREVELGPLATYSIGFLFFWLFAAASSAFSAFLARSA